MSFKNMRTSQITSIFWHEVEYIFWIKVWLYPAHSFCSKNILKQKVVFWNENTLNFHYFVFSELWLNETFWHFWTRSSNLENIFLWWIQWIFWKKTFWIVLFLLIISTQNHAVKILNIWKLFWTTEVWQWSSSLIFNHLSKWYEKKIMCMFI